ncbi:biotin--protein ligase-like [Panonychus citri]|uniref:biotin--protein ligase-like n=1 Tax=Panonychus citri TaxID=50023 RepID=UPI002306EE17|nr:biotin--protein ligase-like [Panonychus citri]
MIKPNIRMSSILSNQRITSCVKKDSVDSSVSPSITAAYCVSRYNNCLNDKLIREVNSNSSLPVFIKNGGNGGDEVIETHPRIPIIFNVPLTSLPFTSFNFDRYFSNLESFRFGHTVVYSEVTTSTIHLMEPLTSIDGLIVVAGQQTQGRGRSGNLWVSPKGCAMFSISCHIPLSSRLGQSLGLVQHLISLAIYRGITRELGYEKSDLHLKWPNDIYWGRTVKIGGIIVSSSLIGNDVHCVAHCGINVNNSHPTQPLNQLLANYPETKNLPPLTIEEVIARTLNELDYLIKETERAGIEMIKKLYIQHWLHSDQKILMADNKEVIIKGIDDHGFMLVEDSTGKILTVQPDGNRFDMMQNLIVKK